MEELHEVAKEFDSHHLGGGGETGTTGIRTRVHSQPAINVNILKLFIKKEAQTRVSRIGNSVHYNDYPYKYSNVNCNDVNDNDYTKLK